MKIKHHAIFNNSLEALDWEALRNDEKESPYFLPFTLKDYLKKVNVDEPSDFTSILIKKTQQLGLAKLFSIGCGIASQEYQIKKFSQLSVTVSDYNDTVFRLREFNIFDECVQLDAFKDKIPVDNSYIMFFHRIDTEFNDKQLKTVFAKCHDAGIRYIYFVPAELLNFKIIISEIKTLILSFVRKKPRVFCGYARSKCLFKKIWGKHYKLKQVFEVGDNFFLLESV